MIGSMPYLQMYFIMFFAALYLVTGTGANSPECDETLSFMKFNVEAAEYSAKIEASFENSCTEYYKRLLGSDSPTDVCKVAEAGVHGLSEVGLERLVKERMRAMVPYLDERKQWVPVHEGTHLFEPLHALMGLLRFVPDCKKKTSEIREEFCLNFFSEQLMNVKYLLRDYQGATSAVGFSLFIRGFEDFGLSTYQAVMFAEKNYVFRYVHVSHGEDWIRRWIPEEDVRFIAPLLTMENYVLAGERHSGIDPKIKQYVEYMERVWMDPLGPLNGRFALSEIVAS